MFWCHHKPHFWQFTVNFEALSVNKRFIAFIKCQLWTISVSFWAQYIYSYWCDMEQVVGCPRWLFSSLLLLAHWLHQNAVCESSLDARVQCQCSVRLLCLEETWRSGHCCWDDDIGEELNTAYHFHIRPSGVIEDNTMPLYCKVKKTLVYNLG